MFVMLDYTNRALKERKGGSYKIGLILGPERAGETEGLRAAVRSEPERQRGWGRRSGASGRDKGAGGGGPVRVGETEGLGAELR
jgi:hypothetical protein